MPYVAPSINDISDGDVINIYGTDGLLLTWNSLDDITVTLNDVNYEKGTYITLSGDYTFYVYDGRESATVSFSIINIDEGRTVGDVDGDGIVTVSDSLMALRISASLDEPSDETAAYAADINADGGINVTDALIILRLVCGIQ